MLITTIFIQLSAVQLCTWTTNLQSTVQHNYCIAVTLQKWKVVVHRHNSHLWQRTIALVAGTTFQLQLNPQELCMSFRSLGQKQAPVLYQRFLTRLHNIASQTNVGRELVVESTFSGQRWLAHVYRVGSQENSPLCSRVIAFHRISTCFSLQVPSNGKQEPLQDCHTHPTPPISHLWNNVHHPAICLWIIALHVAQRLVL
jgi:hypothetical protein